jgi:hypothetical protein
MQAQQRAAAYHATTASSEAPVGLIYATDSAEVDSKKRKANGDDGPSDEQQVVTKRTRFDDVAAGVVTTDGDQPTRDREHCTVFVSGLAPGTSEQSIQQRFKDVSFWQNSSSSQGLLLMICVSVRSHSRDRCHKQARPCRGYCRVCGQGKSSIPFTVRPNLIISI